MRRPSGLNAGESYDDKMAFKFRYIAKRVKRRVPPPRDLVGRLMLVFKHFGNALDESTNKPLFSKDAYAEAKNLLRHAALGCLSDPPEVPLYYLVGRDQDGLNIYRCARGTSSVEGAVHQKIEKNFGPFNASPRFGDNILAHYRHRHNINASILNRLFFPNYGHYHTWLIDEMHTLSIEVYGFSVVPEWSPSSTFPAPTEQFGIIPLASKYLSTLNVEKFDESTAKDTAINHLARRQNAKYPFLPVTTIDEKKLFFQFMREHLSSERGKASKPIDIDALTISWNSRANGTTIFYKIPSHLQSHMTAWKKNENIRNSAKLNYVSNSTIRPSTDDQHLELATKAPIQNGPLPELSALVNTAPLAVPTKKRATKPSSALSKKQRLGASGLSFF